MNNNDAMERPAEKMSFSKYCLVYGLLLWGLPMGILCYLLNSLFDGGFKPFNRFVADVIVFGIFGLLIFGPLARYFSRRPGRTSGNKLQPPPYAKQARTSFDAAPSKADRE
jgi:uncharacterized RDD family membrane protein YckC